MRGFAKVDVRPSRQNSSGDIPNERHLGTKSLLDNLYRWKARPDSDYLGHDKGITSALSTDPIQTEAAAIASFNIALAAQRDLPVSRLLSCMTVPFPLATCFKVRVAR